MRIDRPRLVAVVLACAGILAGPALAQQAPQGSQGQQPRAAPRPAASKATPTKETGRGEAGDPQLKGRVEHLEEQLSDMQVIVGTLESLGRSAGSAPAGGGRPASVGGGGVDQARIDSLETQIRALTAQVEQMAAQMRQLSAARRTDAAPLAPAAPGPFAAAPSPGAFGREPVEDRGGGFGSTTVTAGERGDPIGRIIGSDTPQTASASPALPPQAAQAGNPRELYETAYGYLLQQDYGAAEVAFEEFMRRYPQDRLAADAQYWLGETLYVQRRYKPAGQAFLTVIEKHKASAKVPNSLLKLAQSLDQLGQKDCGIFSELEGRYPNAPADVRVKARALKQKQGC
ncbi:MAG: tol-pal system protein YbgF [Hyphomicrobiaceae bacterium]